jgi:hypothetical protein
LTDLGWKTEAQHVLDMPDDRQASYRRLNGLLAFWTMISFAVPVAIAATFFILAKFKMLEKLPLPLRFHVDWKMLAIVGGIALAVCVLGCLGIRAKMKRIITDYLDSREWS